MSEKNQETLRGQLAAYRSIYRRLYYMACAVAGNDRAAERALVNVMLSVPAEAAEKAIVRAAMAARGETGGETNFDCLLGEEEATQLGDRVACLSEEARRALMLKYGLGLPASAIGEAMRIPGVRVRKLLAQAEAEAARSVRGGEVKKALDRLCRREMDENELAPDFNTLLRAAEKQLMSPAAPRKRRFGIRRTVNWFSAVFTLVVLVALIWCCVVLLDYFRQTQAEARGARVGNVMEITEEFHACV